MSLFDLTGKIAVITGSTKGIGAAIAHRFAEHGANVVISSRKEDVCERVASEINTQWGSGKDVAIPIACNISYKDQLQYLVDRTIERWGQIDTLVCNAAINPYYGPSADIPDEALDKILGTNIRSNLWLANMVLPNMAARNDGAIILVSSIAGLRAAGHIGTYGIAKAAEFQIARNIAAEYGKHNVRANCIAPGVIKTDFSSLLWQGDGVEEKATKTIPLRRFGEADDIAGAAVFLASQAGAYMTGQEMVIDGGSIITGF